MDNNNQSKNWLALILVSVGTFMSSLDASIINVAMPTLTKAFHTTVGTSQWFVLSYTFVVTILLLTFGKLGDLYGRRRLYVYGVAIFSIGSLFCAMSISSVMLIVARGLQGLGSSIVMSCGPALVTEAFPSSERGKAFGFIGTAVAMGLLAGPIVGGLLIQYANWRWMFLINIPIGAVLILLISLYIRGFDENKNGRLDIKGAVLMAIALAALLIACTFGSKFGWCSITTIGLFIMAVVTGTFFLITEMRMENPMLDIGFFKNREFSIGAITGWCSYAASMPLALFIPFYLSDMLNYQPQKIGLILASGPLMLALTAPISGSLSDKIGSRFLTTIGLLIAGIGVLTLRTLGPSSSAFDVVWRLALTNFGAAVFVSPNSSSVMGSVPKQDLGIAAGVIALVRNLGMVCGIAIAGAVILTVQKGFTVTGELADNTKLVHAMGFFEGLKAAFIVSAALLFLGSFLSAMRVRPGDRANMCLAMACRRPIDSVFR